MSYFELIRGKFSFIEGNYRIKNVIFRTSFILIFLILHSCSISNQNLHDISQKLYNEKKWSKPLPPKKFVSDGCSCWPDYEWVECCIEHDLFYWFGGTKEERKQVDVNFRDCVSQEGYPYLSTFMYYGVRLGGVPWLPTSFRWGFGWNYPNFAQPNEN